MKRPVRLLGSAALLVSIWMVIFEAGLRMQQYFGPLYDLEMANVNLDWESDVVNHQPVSQNQNLCFYGDLTGFTYKKSPMPTVSGSSMTRRCWPVVEIQCRCCSLAIRSWRATTTPTPSRIMSRNTSGRIYMAEGSTPPVGVLPPPSPKKYWTRKGIAEWRVERLAEDAPKLVGNCCGGYWDSLQPILTNGGR